MPPPRTLRSPPLLRACAAACLVAAIAVGLGSSWGLSSALLVILSACLWIDASRVAELRRVNTMYQLLVRIGDGEYGASLPDSPDELTLRLQRGIARAQRGYAEALARAESERDEFRTLLGAIQTGLVSLDAQLRIRSANEVAQHMLGLDARAHRGKFLAEVARHPELLRFVEDALTAATPTTREISLSQGPSVTLTIAADPMRDASGMVHGLLLALDDVTRVRRLETVRADFAATVSHELRTPITNIKGYLETLMEVGANDPTQVEHFLGIVHRNTIRLSTLVEDILLLAFLDQPRTGARLEFADVAVLSVARDATSQLDDVAAAKAVTIELHIDPQLGFVVNAGLMSQAILNLVSNALKFAPPSSTVSVAAMLHDGTIELRVTDTGPGIDAIHFDRIFERFYRVDPARSRDLGGTGLGLSIVKHIALIHGGSVDVQCPPQGGSVFFLKTPKGYRRTDQL